MNELERTIMTISCRDCDAIPKVPNAGRIVEENGERVQIMHNGLRVVAGGYYGDWMAQIIRGLRGHHEPQEEMLFHAILPGVRHNSLIVELGAFWSYYTLWYLHEIPGSRAIAVEPDPNNVEIGRRNAALNAMDGRVDYHRAWVGGEAREAHRGMCESDGTERTMPLVDMNAVLELAGTDMVELLHIDAQGAEFPFLNSMERAVEDGRIRFLFVSTHHTSITGSATTHEDCLEIIRRLGGVILAEHGVQQSFSGDGLIVASFYPSDIAIPIPQMARNQPHASLFPQM